MKKLGGHNRHRQWTRHEKEEEPEVKLAKQTVIEARRVFHGSLRVSHSLRSRASRVANGEYPLRNLARPKAVLLLVLLGIGVLFTADQLLKTEAAPYTVSNRQTLWKTTFPGANLNEFKTILATYTASGAYCVTAKCIQLASNSTHAAVALLDTPISVDTVSGHELELRSTYQLNAASPANTGYFWAMYLTRNGTLPIQAGYDPRDDPQVSLVLLVFDDSGGEFAYAWIQRNQTETIRTGDTGGFTNSGTSYLVHSYGQCGAQNGNDVNLVLNFTGNQGTLSKSALESGTGDCAGGSTETTNEVLPWFQFQGTSYFVGFWAIKGLPTPVRYEGAVGQSTGVYRSDPDVSVPQAVPERIDTGGFFGPIIRALIAIGIWILEGIAKYLGFVADVFITAMNAVGGFFGLGAIGTAIRDALTGIANWFSSVFGVAIGWIVTIVSITTAGIGFFTGFFSGSNSFVAWLVSFFTTLPGLWTIVQDLWTALNTVVLTMNQILVIYYLVGMFMVYMDGWPGFLDWLKMGTTLTVSLVKGGFFIAKESWQIILAVKNLVSGWI